MNGKRASRVIRNHDLAVGDVVQAVVRPTSASGVGHATKSRPVVVVEVRLRSVVVLPLSSQPRPGRMLDLVLPGAGGGSSAFHQLVEISLSDLPAHRLMRVGLAVLDHIEELIIEGAIDRSCVDRGRRARRPERRRPPIVDAIHLLPEPSRVHRADEALAIGAAAQHARVVGDVRDLGLGA